MKAAVYEGYGPPEVVRVTDVEKPAPTEDELLIEVHATTVNRTDCAYRGASPFIMRFLTGLTRPRRPILGTEFAGRVVTTGPEANAFSVGDRVFGYVEGRFGAHAQYVTVPEGGSLAVIPPGVSYEQAAPATEGAHYAISSLTHAKVKRGQDVLVYGASGAIGSAAVQLLTSIGVRVTAVCGTDAVELVKGFGADKVVDHTAQDFTQDDQRYDIVFDAVGKSSFGRCRPLLKPGGFYVSSDLGPHKENLVLPLVTPLARHRLDGQRVVFPFPKIDQAMVRHFAELMDSGAFRPVVDRSYPLDDIVEAYRYVETGRKTGNVVVVVDHPE